MRIGEVRTTIEKYSEKELKHIIAEMYKSIPKALKEEKQIDSLLKNPLDSSRHKKAKKNNLPDIIYLSDEVETFISDAKNQYYFAPNSTISKKERPKWRFKVKRFYKDLLSLSSKHEHLLSVEDLLAKLYSLICYSCDYVLFKSYDPFQSIGISQEDFYKSVLTLKGDLKSKKDFVKESILLITENGLSRDSLKTELMSIFLEFLSTPDTRKMAVETCCELTIKMRKEKSRQKNSNNSWYRFNNYMINDIVELTFMCYASLNEYEKGIAYFYDQYEESNPEITLFVLLKFLFQYDQKDLFVKEYLNAVKKGIEPRERLVDIFQTIKETGQLPRSFWH